MVSEIEEREAARFNGYTWRSWLELTKEDRIDNVAYFRLIRILEMNKEDASTREQQRQERLHRNS